MFMRRQKLNTKRSLILQGLKLPTCVFGENHGEPTHSLFEKISLSEEKIAKRMFESFLKYGDFPEILAEEQIDEKESLLKNYKNSYFTRDLAQLINVESVEGIKAMFGALVKGLGSRDIKIFSSVVIATDPWWAMC